MPSQSSQNLQSLCSLIKGKRTEKLLSQHAELLLVEALTCKGGELPAEDLRELAPGGPRWVPKECQVLWI